MTIQDALNVSLREKVREKGTERKGRERGPIYVSRCSQVLGLSLKLTSSAQEHSGDRPQQVGPHSQMLGN